MPVEVAPLPFKPPQLKGFSDRLLVSHYENNYGGAVRRLNAIDQRWTGLLRPASSSTVWPASA